MEEDFSKVESRSIFVPCVRWVKRGVTESVPMKIKLSKEELGEIITQSKSKLPKKKNKTEARENGSENEFEEKYNINTYDEEDSVELNFHDLCSDINDPFINNDSDDDSSDDDDRIYPNDNLVLVAHIDKDTSSLEVYVHNSDDGDLYVHHDVILSDYPLCLEWVGMEPMSEGAPGNLCAVGSMSPIIQMWDINIINCLEPACKLGQKKSKKKQQKQIGHHDAVLDLAWNADLPHILASGSADETVLLWDLDKGLPSTKLSNFSDKVQALKWHPFEGFMLLTGSCDKLARVFDCRTDDTFKQWVLDGEVERVCWNHFNPFEFLACTDAGSVYCMDCRKDTPLWTTQAHSSAVTALTLSASCPGVLTTASMDGDIKVWDIDAGSGAVSPVCVAIQQSRVGPVLCLEFSPDSPFVICAGGRSSSCYFSVWDLKKEPRVHDRFSSRQLLQTKAVASVTDQDQDSELPELEEEGEKEVKTETNNSKKAKHHNKLSSVEESTVRRKKDKKIHKEHKALKTSPPQEAVSIERSSMKKKMKKKKVKESS